MFWYLDKWVENHYLFDDSYFNPTWKANFIAIIKEFIEKKKEEYRQEKERPGEQEPEREREQQEQEERDPYPYYQPIDAQW